MLLERSEARERPRKLRHEIAPATTRYPANRMIIYDFDISAAAAQIQKDVRLLCLRKRKPEYPRPRRCGHLGKRPIVIEINAVISRRGLLARLVIHRSAAFRRHRPVADHRHNRR